jgi:hypothetical protein
MTSKFTKLMLMAALLLSAACSKDDFSERDAIDAQKELLNLKYQHELDLETIRQKGATAMQQLINSAALEQLRFNDSLSRSSAVLAAKKDYSVAVIDAVTNAPISDADVIVSSEGKVFATKTNAQGIAQFNALYLFPTSSFLISKTGFAATQIFQKDITFGPAKLWNSTELSNEISGTLYIDTDLTNTTPEKVGANVLVTATATIYTVGSSFYKVSFPTYSLENGTYSLKLPASPNGYALSFGQVAADQKLYINSTENQVNSYPYFTLPSVSTIKTYFNVNSFNANVPDLRTSVYMKIGVDKAGKTVYIPVNYTYNNNQVLVSAENNQLQVDRLNIYNYYSYEGNYVEVGAYTFEPNANLDVELIDITGQIVKTSPLLTATTNSNGKLIYSNSPEGGSGYVHLKRAPSGALVPNAKGVILKAAPYDSYLNLYTLNFNTNFNTARNTPVVTEYLLPNKGDKRVVNFYYGSGSSRETDVY